MIKALDIINQKSAPEQMAGFLNAKANIEVLAGVADTETITLADAPESIIAVLAIVSATGAVATKFLLDVTTDYTVAGKVLTCVTDQSANKLVVIYK